MLLVKANRSVMCVRKRYNTLDLGSVFNKDQAIANPANYLYCYFLIVFLNSNFVCIISKKLNTLQKAVLL